MDTRLRKAEKDFEKEPTWDAWRLLVQEQYRSGYKAEDTTKQIYKNIHGGYVVVSIIPLGNIYVQFTSAASYNIFEWFVEHSLWDSNTARQTRLGTHFYALEDPPSANDVLRAHLQVMHEIEKNYDLIAFHGDTWIWNDNGR